MIITKLKKKGHKLLSECIKQSIQFSSLENKKIFADFNGGCLTSDLRSLDIDAAMHSRAILKLLVTRIRRQWLNVRIIFRGDSGDVLPAISSG